MSFNTSSKDFANDRFSRLVLQTLDKLQIPAKNLQIEITETTIFNATPALKQRFTDLCKAGIGLAMDDYGTGYATLDTLSQWPFTSIKLDHGIINRMFDSPKNRTIVESSIRMAHELDIAVIAEGVETDAQYQMLLESGCTKVQGYWLSKPLPLDDFIYFIQQDLRWSGLPVGLIHMAVVDHIQWRKKMVSEIVRIAATPEGSAERQLAQSLPMDYRACRLGKWYYGVGQQFRGSAYFDEIEHPHQIFHNLGGQLITTAIAGGTMADLTPILTEFSSCSALILDCLQKLEHQGLMDMHSAHSAWQNHHLYTANNR